jgi:hypothetical protein
LPVSRRVVRALTGDLAFTLRASFSTKWLRRLRVRRGLVRFLGLPIQKLLLLADYLLNVGPILPEKQI